MWGWKKKSASENTAPAQAAAKPGPAFNPELMEGDVLFCAADLANVNRFGPRGNEVGMRQFLVRPMAELLHKKLDEYVAAAVADGILTARWPHLFDMIAEIDPKLSPICAQYVFLNSANAAAALAADPAAHKAGLIHLAQGFITPLTLPDEEAARYAENGYDESVNEEILVRVFDRYAAILMKQGTFAQEWPLLLDNVARLDPEIAAFAAGEIFYSKSAAGLTSPENFSCAWKQLLIGSQTLHLRGFFNAAADTAAHALAIAGELKVPESALAYARENLNAILTDWQAVAFDRADDPRTPEEKETARFAFQACLMRWQPRLPAPPGQPETPPPAAPPAPPAA